jgi:hypothetical protein
MYSGKIAVPPGGGGIRCYVSFMSVSIKVKMSDSDEDPEITSGLKKGGFNVTNCSNRYFNFHFDKSLLCRIRRYIVHSWIKTKQLKKVADIITFFH